MEPTFERELTDLLNRYSKENESNTPDYILSAYLQDCLNTFNKAVRVRAVWYGHMQSPGNPHTNVLPEINHE